MNFPIIYLHIPKTAGTSFRISAAKYFGEKNVLYDYGTDSNATSEELLSSKESAQNIEAIRTAGLRAKMLGGHFSLPKYRDLFPDSPVISFFRDPVDRVVSEFVHFKNHHQYTGTLEEFYRSERFQNRQHKSLGGAKPTDLDFYGLTEQYPHSLKLFNGKYDTALELATLNRGDYGNRKNKVEPTSTQKDEIKHLNQADVLLYEIAVANFSSQKSAKLIDKPPVTQYKGNLGGIRQKKLYGWVFNSESNSPTKVHVSVNGEKRLEVVADIERPDIVKSGLRSDANCGFIVPLNRLGQLTDSDSISIRTADGSYELINSPLIWTTA